MPIYEYRCESCGHVTEALRRMNEADEPIACEKCAARRTKRLHSVFSAASGSGEAAGECPLPMANCGAPGGCCGGGACHHH